MDISVEKKKALSDLFSDEESASDKNEEITRIEELPGIPERLVD